MSTSMDSWVVLFPGSPGEHQYRVHAQGLPRSQAPLVSTIAENKSGLVSFPGSPSEHQCGVQAKGYIASFPGSPGEHQCRV